MKKVALSLALLLSPAIAQASDLPSKKTPSSPVINSLINGGYAEIFGSFTGLSGDFGSEDKDFLGAGGALKWNVPLSNAMSIQIDGVGDLSQNTNRSGNNYQNSFTGGAHLSYREPNSHLFGIFAGGSRANVGDNGHAVAAFVGGEGQIFLGNETLYFQAGYLNGESSSSSTDGVLSSAYFARAQLRHYFNDNFRAAIDLSYANGKVDEEPHTDVFGWSGELEYKIEKTPVSVFVAYNGTYMDQTPGEDDTLFEHVGIVGLRYSFDSNSLLKRDRLGAGLDMPRFGRWLGEAAGPLE